MPSSSSSSPAPGVRSVTLKKGITGTYVEGRTQGYLLRLEITETVGVDPYLFVFQRTNSNDEFSNVASSIDLDVYPAETPIAGGIFFRRAVASLVFRGYDALLAAALEIENDIMQLLAALTVLDAASVEDIVVLQ